MSLVLTLLLVDGLFRFGLWFVENWKTQAQYSRQSNGLTTTRAVREKKAHVKMASLTRTCGATTKCI
jgi:hypothetical protein